MNKIKPERQKQKNYYGMLAQRCKKQNIAHGERYSDLDIT
jgi:hypothetical protein